MSSLELSLSASGSILQELSKNIPSTKFALIELIKNAYEAGAHNVDIELSNDYLLISDDGNGISQNDLSSLLKVSSSNKKFGEIINGRIISGEKGLGFYSSFKFGNIVSVESVHNKIKTNFQLSYSKIVECLDINDYKVPIEIEHTEKENGTIIKILEINAESFKFLTETLSSESSRKKIEKAIVSNNENDEFTINIVPKQSPVSKGKRVVDIKQYRIANLVYKSKGVNQKVNNIIDIKMDGNNENIKIPIPNKYLPLITHKYIEFDINIEYFNFNKVAPKITKEDINQLFISGTTQNLTPLIYINNALFDNYQMYDVEINSSLKSEKVIRQQIGFIHILITKEHIIEFNSDRTAINESEIQILIKQFLDFISSESQIRIKREVKSSQKVGRESPKILQPIFKGCRSYELEKIILNGAQIKYYYEGKNVSCFDSKLAGTWEIENEKNKFRIIVYDYLLPSIKMIENSCNSFEQYNIDDFFEFYNSVDEKNKDIKPNITFDDASSKKIKFNKQTGEIEFKQSGNYKIKIQLYDKKSKLECNGEFNIFVRDNFENIEEKPIKNSACFLQLLINPDKQIKLKNDVHCFVEEINQIYLLNRFDSIFVSSARTLIELIVNDIEEIHNNPLNKLEEIIVDEASLSPRYEKIMRIIIVKFPMLVSDNPDNINRKIIAGVINTVKDNYTAKGLISFLNLATHQGTRFIVKDDIVLRKMVFCIMLTYLNEISKL